MASPSPSGNATLPQKASLMDCVGSTQNLANAQAPEAPGNKAVLAKLRTIHMELRHLKQMSLAAKVMALIASPLQKKLLNLCHDWLETFMPHCMMKVNRVSFGLLNDKECEAALADDPHVPRSRIKLAVPFLGKDVPSKSSEFAHPDVIIGVTILAYRYSGIRKEDFTDMMDSMVSEFSHEVGPPAERPSCIRHEAWVYASGGRIRGKKKIVDGEVVPIPEDDDSSKEVVALKYLQNSNKEQMEKLYNLWQAQPLSIHYYLNRFIYPEYTRAQRLKFSASGQEVGGDTLVGRRAGFSGTPSDLLPLELGKCSYETGDDGKMLSTMLSSEIVTHEALPDGWSVDLVLERIATGSDATNYNALIDTGALITGYSNLQVAEKLLELGLPWCEGVVFLNDADQQKVLVRATGRVVDIDQCGISLTKRFAFYDQIHTTGMDIKHVVNATAVLTLGKDMVWRDYVQGAFRMRGIGKGQQIHLFIIPEVKQLMKNQIQRSEAQLAAPDADCTLDDIVAWLVINSMKTEQMQWSMLQIQNVANLYRKNAFRMLHEPWAAGHEPAVIDFVDPAEPEAAVPEVKAAAADEADPLDVGFEAIYAARAEKLGQAFDLFDTDSDGTLSKQELLLLSKAQGLEGEWTEARNAQMVSELDENSDGVISKDEFVDYFCNSLSLDEREFEITVNQFMEAANENRSIKRLTRQLSGDGVEVDQPPHTQAGSLRVFLEDIDFSLEAAVPDPVPFDQRLSNMLHKHANFIVTPDEHKAAFTVMEEVGRFAMLEASSTSLETEQEREQEQEQQKEVQARRDQQIEIEKFVDREYSRNQEQPTPWSVRMLGKTVNDIVAGDHPFYPLNEFKLNHHYALDFPDTMHLSRNFFNPEWSGLRRIKNVVVTMEWSVGDQNIFIDELSDGAEALKEHQEAALTEAHALLSAAVGSDSLNRQGLAKAVQAVTDMEPTDELLDRVLARFADGGQPGQMHLSLSALRKLLQSKWLHRQTPGRNWVAVSLAEAETIRRVMHLRSNRPFMPESNVDIALRFSPSAMPSVMATERNRGGTQHPDILHFTKPNTWCRRYHLGCNSRMEKRLCCTHSVHTVRSKLCSCSHAFLRW